MVLAVSVLLKTLATPIPRARREDRHTLTPWTRASHGFGRRTVSASHSAQPPESQDGAVREIKSQIRSSQHHRGEPELYWEERALLDTAYTHHSCHTHEERVLHTAIEMGREILYTLDQIRH